MPESQPGGSSVPLGGDAPLPSAGLVSLEDPLGGGNAFFCLLGLTPAEAVQHEGVALAGVQLSLRAFHRAGEPMLTNRVTQLGRVEWIAPMALITLPTAVAPSSTRVARPSPISPPSLARMAATVTTKMM